MPKLRSPDDRGDLYATVEAKLPDNLSNAETEQVEQWQTIRSQ
jgi:curved DNA-binding protein